MTCCYEDTSAPPIDSKRCHTRKRENKTLWGSKCSAGILDKTHFNQLVPWKLSFLSYLSVSDSHSNILRKLKASLYWLSYERTHSFFIFFLNLLVLHSNPGVYTWGSPNSTISPRDRISIVFCSGPWPFGPSPKGMAAWTQNFESMGPGFRSYRLKAISCVAVYKVNYVTSLWISVFMFIWWI